MELTLLLSFAIGWVLGSFSLYAYLALTSRDAPHPECVDCTEDSCEGCSTLHALEEERYRLAA